MSIDDRISKVAAAIRGHYIQLTVEFESLMDIYIAEHFAKEGSLIEEFVTLILAPRVTLDNKKQIFEYLVAKYNPEFKKTYPKFNGDFKSIIEHRNVFAHYPVDFSDEAKQEFEQKGIVTFVKLKNSKDYGLAGKIEVTQEQINGNLRFISVYNKALRDLVGGFRDGTDTTSPPE